MMARKNNAMLTPLVPEGFPLISGLGYQLGTAISIQTEATANPINNHSIIGLTDAVNDKDWEVAA